jgi:hypothetical protein
MLCRIQAGCFTYKYTNTHRGVCHQ